MSSQQRVEQLRRRAASPESSTGSRPASDECLHVTVSATPNDLPFKRRKHPYGCGTGDGIVVAQGLRSERRTTIVRSTSEQEIQESPQPWMLVRSPATRLCMAKDDPPWRDAPWRIEPHDGIRVLEQRVGPPEKHALGDPRRLCGEFVDIRQLVGKGSLHSRAMFVSESIQLIKWHAAP